MIRPLTYAGCLLLAIILNAGCSGKPSDKVAQKDPAKKYAEIPLRVEHLFPDSSVAFARVGHISILTRSQAYERLGQLANQYWEYGFIGLGTATYTSGDVRVSAEIAQFEDAVHAYGFYSLVRPEGIATLQLGSEGYQQGHSLYFTQQEYVVTLSSLNESTQALPVMDLLAKSVSERIGDSAAVPLMFTLFPREHRIPASGKFFPVKFLDIPGLHAVFSVDYVIDGDSLTLFIAPDSSGEQFMNLTDYASSIGQMKLHPHGLGLDDGYSLSFPHPTYGVILAGLKQHELIGVVGYNHQTYGALVRKWVDEIPVARF